MTPVRPIAALALALCSLAAGVAQDEPKNAPTVQPDKALVEKVDVHLLTVSISATDRQGRPIRDLQAGDIVVKYQGRKANVAYLEPFRRREPGAQGPAAPVPARLFLDVPGGWPEPVTPVVGTPEYWLFLVDVLNDPPLRRDEALRSTVEFIRSSLPSNVVGAVAVYNGDLHLEVPFTANRDALVTGLGQAWSRRHRATTDVSARTRQLLDRLDDCVLDSDDRNSTMSDVEFSRRGSEVCIRDVVNEHTSEWTPDALGFLKALGRVVQYAGGLEGRKTVIALSHGVIADTTMEVMSAAQAVFGATDQSSTIQLASGFGAKPKYELDRIGAQAQKLRVTIHFADRYPAPTQDSNARGGRMYAPGTSPYLGAWQQSQADMEEITSATGGIVAASPRIEEALLMVRDALEGGYEVGFQVEPGTVTNRAGIKVTSKRGGVRIKHRGAYQTPPATEVSDMSGRIVLEERQAASGPTEIERTSFRVVVQARPLGYRAAGDEMATDLTIGLTVKRDDGTPVIESYNLVRHSLPTAIWTSTPELDMELKGWVELPPGRYTLVARFRNTETGWSGQVVQPLSVMVDEDDRTARPATSTKGGPP